MKRPGELSAKVLTKIKVRFWISCMDRWIRYLQFWKIYVVTLTQKTGQQPLHYRPPFLCSSLCFFSSCTTDFMRKMGLSFPIKAVHVCPSVPFGPDYIEWKILCCGLMSSCNKHLHYCWNIRDQLKETCLYSLHQNKMVKNKILLLDSFPS